MKAPTVKGQRSMTRIMLAGVFVVALILLVAAIYLLVTEPTRGAYIAHEGR